MSWLNESLPVILRLCLVALFPFSALYKIVNWPIALQQAAGLPWPQAVLAAGVAVEISLPLCIVSGWHDRLAAFALAGFCLVTAILFHQFWRFPGFWRHSKGEGLTHFWDFMKNLALAGGLALFALAAASAPFSAFLRDPLESTRPTTSPAPMP